MATITKSFVETGASSTWTVTATAKDMPLSVNTKISREYCATLVGRYSPYSGKNGADIGTHISYRARNRWGTLIELGYENQGSADFFALSANVNYTFPIKSASYFYNIAVGDFFGASNSTERRVPINAYVESIHLESGKLYSGGGVEYPIGYYDNYSTTDWGVISYFVLDAPPTFDDSGVSINTSSAYAGITTASVTISNLSAKYGGTIADVTLAIGNQTVSRTDDGTLSILLNQGGTFTPTLTVTDSRGQVTTKTLDALTVNVYTAPSVTFSAERTTATGTPDDEGTYTTIDATLTFADVIANAVAPTIVVTDEDGNAQTVSTTWYSTRASDGTLSGSVTWANLSSGDTVYGLVSITGGFDTQKSYEIALTPEDSESTGTTITQTLATAFYTVDFLAGGHGIAFGKPATDEVFECAMPTSFLDMTSQEIDDFVDSIGGGGDPIADIVIEKGTEGLWTYRKWNSGMVEGWYAQSVSVAVDNAYGYAYYHDYPTSVPYPTMFVSHKTINTGWIGGNNLIRIIPVEKNGNYLRIYSVAPYNASVSGTLCIYMMGSWK